MNDNLLGRITALALILGTVYGVHAIARGGFACPLGKGSCCVMAIPHDEAPAAEAAAPAKLDAVGADDEAKLQKKAPVVPPAAKTDSAD